MMKFKDRMRNSDIIEIPKRRSFLVRILQLSEYVSKYQRNFSKLEVYSKGQVGDDEFYILNFKIVLNSVLIITNPQK